jgi:twitching motility protein PilT
MEVVEILKKAIDQNASDIFFVAGSPCMFKVGQQLVKVTQEKMMPNDTKDIVQQLYGFAPYCSYENFVANGEDDFSFSLSQVGRFRVNVYRQRNSEAAVLRG